MKTILAFGNFDLEGGRSWAIRTGLQEHGWEIVLCRTEAKGVLGKYRNLRDQWKKLPAKPDAVYVPFLGHWILPLAWWLAKRNRIPLVFDAFLSLYDTEVHDRRRLSPWHPKAWFLWWTDWICCRLCDRVLLDTDEHAAYFAKTFGVRAEKILALPIGCRTDLFHPLETERDHQGFLVEFHGTFIPLQGIDVILRAAKLLEEKNSDVRFHIIGKGQMYKPMVELAKQLELQNVEFAGMQPMETLPETIAEADVCLGIFGVTDKADRVIPNKAYEILNCGKPLITGRTTATRRVLQDEVEAMLVTPGDADELAWAILLLRDDPGLRESLARNGRRLSLERFQPHAIVSPLSTWLQKRLEQ